MPLRFATSFFHSQTWSLIPRHDQRLFIALLVVHFFLSGWFISRLDFTSDETGYFGYAIRWANGQQERIVPVDDSKTPMVAPALVPTVFKSFFETANDPHGFKILQAGRWCMYVYQLLGAVFMLFWLFRLWGSRAWLLPMVLYLFDPLVFSYGMMVGSDLPTTALLLATCYHLWRYSQTRLWKYWLWMCLFCGLALVAKASMVYLLPLIALLLIIHHFSSKNGEAKGFFANALGRWMMLAAVSLLIINTAYFFKGSFFPFGQLPAKSTAMQQVKSGLNFLDAVPVPLPYHFVTAFDELSYHAQIGGGPQDEQTFVGVTVLGQYFVSGPIWNYYLMAFLYKLPLLIILLLIATVVVLVRQGMQRQWLVRYVFIWLPAAYFFTILSLTNPFQIGIRHALLVFPFLYLGISVVVVKWWHRHRQLFRALLVLHLIGIVSFWPNLLAYTNELLWPKSTVYRYFNDSSLNYGHTSQYLKQFLAKNPDYQVPDSIPKAGKYAIEMERLANPFNEFGLNWLKDHFTPVGQYMHSIVLFEITNEALRKEGLLK